MSSYNVLMTATTHALAGALIAGSISNPIASITASFLSHFALDFIPHWDFGIEWRNKSKKRLFWELLIDITTSAILAFLLYAYLLNGTDYVRLFLSVLAAQLPDYLSVPGKIFRRNFGFAGIRFPSFLWMRNIQKICHNKLNNPFWGITTQVISVLAVYVLLYRLF